MSGYERTLLNGTCRQMAEGKTHLFDANNKKNNNFLTEEAKMLQQPALFSSRLEALVSSLPHLAS